MSGWLTSLVPGHQQAEKSPIRSRSTGSRMPQKLQPSRFRQHSASVHWKARLVLSFCTCSRQQNYTRHQSAVNTWPIAQMSADLWPSVGDNTYAKPVMPISAQQASSKRCTAAYGSVAAHFWHLWHQRSNSQACRSRSVNSRLYIAAQSEALVQSPPANPPLCACQ
jgi:hypothetical protein